MGSLIEPRTNARSGVIRKIKRIDTSVLELARERINHAFDHFDTVAVSFSGGKDSTVVLKLCIEAAIARRHGKLLAFFYDEEAIPFETEHYVRRVAETEPVDLRWLCLPVQHRNACTRKAPYWYPWAPEARDLWVRPLPPEAITEIDGFPTKVTERPSIPDSVGLLFPARDYGRTAMMMGIRAEESITRLRAVLMRSRDPRSYIRAWTGGSAEKNLFKVYPIYDWQTQDVWTAPKLFGWDYNRAYDMMEMSGMSHKDQRCAPPYGEEPMAGLWRFAVCFPDIWDKMSRRVPGAATAARYARSELYSFGGAPDKPAGMTWPKFIRLQIKKHPPEFQGEIAGRVRNWINAHHDKTGDPLAVSAQHPVSGISWNFVLNIAMRGDFKNRRQANVRPDDYAKNKARYDAEIAAMKAAGELDGPKKTGNG